MNIFGEEYGFLLTVGASAEIADLCPDGDLNRMNELLSGKMSKTIDFTASFIAAMAKGYDQARMYEGHSITHKPLTAEMVKALPSEEFANVQKAALAAFRGDTKTTVEVEPSKKAEDRQASS